MKSSIHFRTLLTSIRYVPSWFMNNTLVNDFSCFLYSQLITMCAPWYIVFIKMDPWKLLASFLVGGSMLQKIDPLYCSLNPTSLLVVATMADCIRVLQFPLCMEGNTPPISVPSNSLWPPTETTINI